MDFTKETKSWESKDRTYLLQGESPLTYKIKTRGILVFDEGSQTNREVRYSINQKSLFVDEQDTNVRLGHVLFSDGTLFVPRTNPLLQQLLSVLHPEAGQKWIEHNEVKIASDEVDSIELEMEALSLVQNLDIESLEAIMRTELGSGVVDLSSRELKRDAYKFAKTNPKLFIELSKDEDINLRNLANRAVELNILKLTDGNTVFKFAANGKKVLTVPFDQHPYAALSQYFKTDDGVALMKSITKKIG